MTSDFETTVRSAIAGLARKYRDHKRVLAEPEWLDEAVSHILNAQPVPGAQPEPAADSTEAAQETPAAHGAGVRTQKPASARSAPRRTTSRRA